MTEFLKIKSGPKIPRMNNFLTWERIWNYRKVPMFRFSLGFKGVFQSTTSKQPSLIILTGLE